MVTSGSPTDDSSAEGESTFGDFTEEDLRGRVILPYLARIGFTPDQISLERTFSIRIGRNPHVIGNPGKRDRAGGRLDILVKNPDGQSLFVMELKSPSETLSDDDRDQGISYARQLPEMAPFTLVTNGIESHLYDTVTKREVSGEAITDRWHAWRDGTLSLDDIALRFQALRHFVGYSIDNVRAFCRLQQSIRMQSLRSRPGMLDRKYIPDAYVPRCSVRDKVDAFINGSDSCFVLVGESGVGKTVEMCALAERLADRGHLVLFFNGPELYGTFAHRIADEFNWHFSEQQPLPLIVRRLSELASSSHLPAIIVVDAIDEAPLDDAPRELSDLANRLDAYSGSVRLMLSMKTADWARFSQFAGNPSPLALAVSGSHGEATDRSGPPKARGMGDGLEPSAVMPQFSRAEVNDAVDRYSQLFGLTTRFDPELAKAIADPLILRLASEVLAEKAHTQSVASVAEVVPRYIATKLTKCRESGKRELLAIARALVASQGEAAPSNALSPIRPPLVNAVAESAVRQQLNLSDIDPVADDLIAQGLVITVRKERGERWFAFAYDRVRDYLVAEAVGLLAFDSSDLHANLPSLLENSLTASALDTFSLLASDEQWAGVNSRLIESAEKYAIEYQRLRDLLRPVLRDRILPYTLGPIGVVIQMRPRRKLLIGFCAIRQIAPRVIEVQPPAHILQYTAARNTPSPEGVVYQVESIDTMALLRDPLSQAARRMIAQTAALASAGGLDETVSATLTSERVVCIANAHYKQLHLSALPTTACGANSALGLQILPLDLAHLARRLNIEFGTEFFKQEYVRSELEAIRASTPPGETPPRYVTVTQGPTEIQSAHRRAEAAVEEGRSFATPRIQNYALAGLPEALATAIVAGPLIETPVLPPPDRPEMERRVQFSFVDDTYSDAALTAFLEEFFRLGLNAYADLVRHNFGSLASALPLWRRLPVVAVVRYGRPTHRDAWNRCGVIEYALAATNETSTWVDVQMMPGNGGLAHRFRLARQSGEEATVLTKRGPVVLDLPISMIPFSALLSQRRQVPFQWHGHASTAERNAWIRAWVYDVLLDELSKLSEDVIASITTATGQRGQ